MKHNSFDDVAYSLSIIAKRTAFIKKKEAVLNEKINDFKSKFEVETAEATAEINMLNSDIEKFCLLNKDKFEEKRTMELGTGTIGFRTNPPKIAQLNRKYTVSTSIELIKSIFKGKYLRKKEEIDKEQIQADYAQQKIDDAKLASVGLKIDQAETFYITPDWEKFIEEKHKVNL